MKKKAATKIVIIAFSLFLGAVSAFAQETIAVHPLDNKINSPMARIFQEELIRAIPVISGYRGDYSAILLDLVNNRPADVPPGGFPSYMCPPPSLTRGAPYAITGEVGRDDDGDWVRLYLWNLDGEQLIASEMTYADDRESAVASYPYLLEFLYSKIDEFTQLTQPPPPPPRLVEFQSNTDQRTRLASYGESWLYVGGRLGAGNAIWKQGQIGYTESPNITTDFLDVNAAVQVMGNLYYPFAVQVEAILHGHFAESKIAAAPEDPPVVPADPDAPEKGMQMQTKKELYWSLTVPLFVRVNIFTGPFVAGIYAGPWLFFALDMDGKWYTGEDNNKLGIFPESNAAMGLSYGLSVGWRVGSRSTIFMDARFSHLLDFGKDRDSPTNPFPREQYPFYGSSLSIGYQAEFINKHR